MVGVIVFLTCLVAQLGPTGSPAENELNDVLSELMVIMVQVTWFPSDAQMYQNCVSQFVRLRQSSLTDEAKNLPKLYSTSTLSASAPCSCKTMTFLNQ